MSTEQRDTTNEPTPLPRVPTVEDPTHETPLTEDFEPGTANDPTVRATDEVTVTVDGHSVVVPEGRTLMDVVDDLETEENVPALCYYDRETEAAEHIGPRSECRTCMVDTEEHGTVPACSFPVEEGLTVHTDGADASEARDVNLDLVLSNHNLRCTTCNANGDCELQEASIENDVWEPRYGVFDERSEYEPLDDTSSFIQIDRNKCILCNRCVEACNDVQVSGVLRIENHEGEPRIAFQNGAETMASSTCVSCGHCSTVCPTGALTEKHMGGVATLPIPGFNQKNSIGKSYDHEPTETTSETVAANRGRLDAGVDPSEKRGVARYMTKARQKAGVSVKDAGKKAWQQVEHAAEDVAASTMPEGVLFGIADTWSDHQWKKVDKTETTCGYCAVGCRFDVYTKDDDFLAVQPTEAENAPANDFSTCVKGKFGYEFVDDEARLEKPLVRISEERPLPAGQKESEEYPGFREVSWDEALDVVADGLQDIRSETGPDSLACFASSKGTNEEAYLVQKFARSVVGTKNIDNCARLCHSSTVAALQQTVGYGAMTNRINEDIAEADAYLITGSNTTESHPVLSTRIKQNLRDGAELYVFDPRKVEIAEHATQYARTKPGYDVAWLNGLTRYVIEHDLHDRAFIEERTKNFEELKEKIEPFTPEEVERLAGVSPEELETAARAIAEADKVVFGWAMGMTQHAHGTQNCLALANLALVTGNVGKQGAGLSPFRGQNNVQGGGGDMGTLPTSLPGYQDLTDPDVLDKFEDEWGVRPPDEEGLKVPQVFDEALEGNVEGMYIVGENPALSEPDIDHATQALEELSFLVVQDIFMTETAEFADVILPAATFPEKDGTFTNTERRVQRVRKAMNAPGEARTDMDILCDLAGRFGHEWDYDSSADVMDEISRLVPIYGGMSHDRLDDLGGIQWPCWDDEHPGTDFLYEEEFNFDDGLARFVPADMGKPGELPDEEFPLTMTSGRVLYHWHTGTLTRRVEGLMHHVGESFVELHPTTAERLGVADGEYVRVTSKRGDIVVKAEVTDRVGEGVVFVPMHFAAGAVNKLTQEKFDPQSGIPEYKVASVRVDALGPEPDEDPFDSTAVAGDD
ncbi:formate dehydrogenase subunit alpha [Halomarina rubra]|uniref:Formate dehydrogenase subunit alpha n=1 Tax=Halomarina rubra TaxID=2071873 RepID=A0ABD6AU80_9EURY|nr:formate dehydrogenase subunit alpha [Halomarina rubra]